MVWLRVMHFFFLCFSLSATNCSIELNEPSTSSSQTNTAALTTNTSLGVSGLEELITVSDLDDSVEDPDFELTESVKDTSFESDADSTFRDIGSGDTLQQNRQPEIHFVAAYPGPVFTFNEHSNMLSNFTLSQSATPQTIDVSVPTVIKQNKNKIKHPMIVNSYCDGKCKRQCLMFSLEWRKEIWDKYWDQNFVSRRSFLHKCINICSIK